MLQLNYPLPPVLSMEGDFQYTPITQEERESTARLTAELFASPALDSIICLACAMSPRGRERIRRHAKENTQLLPEGKGQKSYLEIDAYASAMNGLLNKERSEKPDGRPEKSMRIVQAAFPRIYQKCMSIKIDDPLSIGVLTSTFFELCRANETGLPENWLNTEQYYILGIILWMCKVEGWELNRLDFSLPSDFIGVMKNRNKLSKLRPCSLDFDRKDPEGKKRRQEFESRLRCREITCSQVAENSLYSKSAFQMVMRLYAIMGETPLLQETLESTEISKEEYLRLCRMEQDTNVPVSKLLTLFAVFKQSCLEQDYLTAINDNLEEKYNACLQQLADMVPVDDRLVTMEQENARYAAAAAQAEKDASAAISSERGMRSELAGANKRLRELEKHLEGYENDKRELAELRETLYEIGLDMAGDETRQQAEIVFPYTDLPERIVCIGANDQWRGKMQELLPGVRFAPPNTHLSLDLIRNASCVWIHPACFAHKAFDRVIDTAREYGKPRHYFRSLGVLSSAKLLVETMNRLSR